MATGSPGVSPAVSLREPGYACGQNPTTARPPGTQGLTAVFLWDRNSCSAPGFVQRPPHPHRAHRAGVGSERPSPLSTARGSAVERAGPAVVRAAWRACVLRATPPGRPLPTSPVKRPGSQDPWATARGLQQTPNGKPRRVCISRVNRSLRRRGSTRPLTARPRASRRSSPGPGPAPTWTRRRPAPGPAPAAPAQTATAGASARPLHPGPPAPASLRAGVMVGGAPPAAPAHPQHPGRPVPSESGRRPRASHRGFCKR